MGTSLNAIQWRNNKIAKIDKKISLLFLPSKTEETFKMLQLGGTLCTFICRKSNKHVSI